MEDGQDSDGVVSVTDSEDEEQKAKDLDREEIFMFTGIQKCINLTDRDDALMHHSVGRSHFQPHVRVDDFKFYNVVDACSSAHAEWSLANQCFTQIKEHKSPQWVWIPGAWEFSPKFEVDR